MSKRWYGSLTNRLMESPTTIKAEIGMGATLTSYTDRTAGTVVEVFTKNGKTFVVVQEDNAERTDDNGMSESQEYAYTPNPNGSKHTYRQEENGQYVGVKFNEKTKRWAKTDGLGLCLGHRDEHYDYNF
jgi:hypothetical protein